MNSATLTRDPLLPVPPRGRGPALALAVLAHGLLILAIAFGVHWKRFDTTPMAAELWSAVPQAAAPRAVEPPAEAPPKPAPPKPVEPVAPPPSPRVVEAPRPALPDPQIAIEQERRAAAERERAQAERDKQRQDSAAREKAEREKQAALKQQQQQLEAKQRAQAKAEAAQQARDAAQAAKVAEEQRKAYMQRMLGMAGATGAPTDSGSAQHSSGPSASYAGRIMARIKPNIVFSDPIDGNPIATVEVKLAPDGSIVARRLVKSSGVKAWDDAVLRAIDRTEILPRDVDGRVPPPFQIDFRPRDVM